MFSKLVNDLHCIPMRSATPNFWWTRIWKNVVECSQQGSAHQRVGTLWQGTRKVKPSGGRVFNEISPLHCARMTLASEVESTCHLNFTDKKNNVLRLFSNFMSENSEKIPKKSLIKYFLIQDI